MLLPRTIAAAFLLTGCAAHRPPRVDPDVAPVLPAPRGDVYARGPASPRDPLVASIAAGLPWDEVLSGAAAGVALAVLAGDPADAPHVRWKAIVAGYPYPVVARSVARVAHGEVPAALVEEARSRTGRDVDLGLVRARGQRDDVWVLLVGERRADLAPFPRELRVGEAITPAPGVRWTVADPAGEAWDVDGAFVPDMVGEWLVRVRVDDVPVAVVPLYVGVDTPEAPPLARDGAGSTPEAQARALVNALRASADLSPLAQDPALDSVARARLRATLAGQPLPDARGQLAAAGYLDVPVAGAECRAATVAACLDQVWWSVERRAVFYGDLSDVGVAVEADAQGVQVVLLAAG